MDEEILNVSIRRFLKLVGIKSQREIEQAVAKAIANGKLTGQKSLPVSMSLHLGTIEVNQKFDGTIDLE
jgi:Family of unknown function (DUF6494)